MKKVICINDNPSENEEHTHLLKEGLVYTVIYDGLCRDKRDPSGFSHGYALQEIGFDFGFNKERFIPLSEIDETSFERNYKKELV